MNELKLCPTCGQAVIPRRCNACGAVMKAGEDAPWCQRCRTLGFETEPLPFEDPA